MLKTILFGWWTHSLLGRTIVLLLLLILPLYGLVAGLNYQQGAGLLRDQAWHSQATWVDLQREAVVTVLGQELDRLITLSTETGVLQEAWDANTPQNPAALAALWAAAAPDSPIRTRYV